MTVNPIMKIIRAKKLGVLIRDARMKSGKSAEECAQAMGISVDELKAVEFGERPPTMPELELLAYFLEIPLDHFWGSEMLKQTGSDKNLNPLEISKIRQVMIGSLIAKGRNAANLTLEELAQKAGITADSLEAVEKGDLPIPLTELESVAQALNNSISYYEDQEGPVGSWFSEQKCLQEFQKLPAELQDFVSKPINRPYLELAVRLSELRVDRLRALGEGLLEITL